MSKNMKPTVEELQEQIKEKDKELIGLRQQNINLRKRILEIEERDLVMDVQSRFPEMIVRQGDQSKDKAAENKTAAS